MSSAEFTDWVAYAQIEPFGQVRADLRAGLVASVIAEVYRDPKHRPEPFTPADFMPAFDTEPDPGPDLDRPPPDPDALFKKLKAGLQIAGKGKGKDGDPK